MTLLNDLQPSLDEIFAAHEGGKLATGLEAPLADARDLAIAYTPGVAQVSRAVPSGEKAGWLQEAPRWRERIQRPSRCQPMRFRRQPR